MVTQWTRVQDEIRNKRKHVTINLYFFICFIMSRVGINKDKVKNKQIVFAVVNQ